MAVKYFCDRCGEEVKGIAMLSHLKIAFSDDEDGIIGQLCNSAHKNRNCMFLLKEDFMKPIKEVK